MLVRLFTVVAMCLWSASLATGASFDEASAQWSVLDLMFITIIILLVSNCYLLSRMSTARSGTSSLQSLQSTHDVKKTGGVKKQAASDAADDRIPNGDIFLAQNSKRWHGHKIAATWKPLVQKLAAWVLARPVHPASPGEARWGGRQMSLVPTIVDVWWCVIGAFLCTCWCGCRKKKQAGIAVFCHTISYHITIESRLIKIT